MPDRTMAPAGLWVRILAFLVDYVPIAVYLAVLVAGGTWLGRALEPLSRALFGGPVAGEATGFLLITLPVTLYFALSEASSRGNSLTPASGRYHSPATSPCRSTLSALPWCGSSSVPMSSACWRARAVRRCMTGWRAPWSCTDARRDIKLRAPRYTPGSEWPLTARQSGRRDSLWCWDLLWQVHASGLCL